MAYVNLSFMSLEYELLLQKRLYWRYLSELLVPKIDGIFEENKTSG